MMTASQHPATITEAPLRVMVVDDSLVLRGILKQMINESPLLAEVVATAANGQIAVERAKVGDIDVIILDIEMPVMDGITALPLLIAAIPNVVVIMASTLTTRNAEISLRAIKAGAKDYVAKPTSTSQGANREDFRRELLEKIEVLGYRFRNRNRGPRSAAATPLVAASKEVKYKLRPKNFLSRPKVLGIGSSTGGPNALHTVLKNLPSPLKMPVLITQHMPANFTGLLAQSLTRDTGHQCAEGVDGEELKAGRIYIAPGDFHMLVVRQDDRVTIRLNQEPKENFCRPAVDPLFRSLAAVFHANVLVAMLTGMGQDGLLGSESIVNAGGNLIAQDEETSTVWGMPGAVAKAGLCCGVLPLNEVAPQLLTLMGR